MSPWAPLAEAVPGSAQKSRPPKMEINERMGRRSIAIGLFNGCVFGDAIALSRHPLTPASRVQLHAEN